jgi:two-component system nitrogen regulation response regulator GlnG
MMPKLLVIDDEPAVCYSFRRVFAGGDVDVLTAPTAGAGLEAVRGGKPDAVVLDLQLPDRDGLSLFRDLREEFPRLPVIFITAHGTAEAAIEAMKHGAFDYLLKPLDVDRITQVVNRAFESARLAVAPAELPEDPADRIVGRSPAMQEVCKAIGRVAPQDVNVLILGESGVGKELAARAIFQHSKRADRAFLAVNCAAIPEALLESELFGHEQGAFTGAERKRIGRFEQANGGTLFLDEIGDMAPAAQAKILRVLQDQSFERVGGSQTVRTQVRVIAATNQALDKLVSQGRFRTDLYYRLAGVTITVPPLRERPDDVPELAHHFLFRYGREAGRDLRGFSPEALEMLRRYPWPGNVREMQGVIRQAILRSTGHLLLAEFLPESVRGATPAMEEMQGKLDVEALIESLLQGGETGLYEKVVHAVERVLLPRVLKQTHGHQAQASAMLGLNRTTLRTKLRDLGLSVERVVSDAPADQGEPG